MDCQLKAQIQEFFDELDILLTTRPWTPAVNDAYTKLFGAAGQAGPWMKERPSTASIEFYCNRACASSSAFDGSLQAELESMKLSALRKRAVAANVTDDKLEKALDKDDPKGAVVELILQKVRLGADPADTNRASELEAQQKEQLQLRTELAGMRLSALKNRAVAANVTAEQLDAAFDAEDIKTTVVNLIVAASL